MRPLYRGSRRLVAVSLPRCPMGVPDGLGLQRLRGWPSGVYRLPNRALPLRLVVAAELPRIGATLLRALGTGRVLRKVLTDLASLPDDAWSAPQPSLHCTCSIEVAPCR